MNPINSAGNNVNSYVGQKPNVATDSTDTSGAVPNNCFVTALEAIEHLRLQIPQSVRHGNSEALKARVAILSKLQNYSRGDSIQVTLNPALPSTQIIKGNFEFFSFDSIGQLHLNYTDNQGTRRLVNIDQLSVSFKPQHLEVHHDKYGLDKTTITIASRKEEFTAEDFMAPESYPNPPNSYYEARDNDGFGTMEYEYMEEPSEDIVDNASGFLNSYDPDNEFKGAFDGNPDHTPYQEHVIVIENLSKREF